MQCNKILNLKFDMGILSSRAPKLKVTHNPCSLHLVSIFLVNIQNLSQRVCGKQ